MRCAPRRTSGNERSGTKCFAPYVRRSSGKDSRLAATAISTSLRQVKKLRQLELSIYLWTGDNRKRMARILDALADAEIPFHSKEQLKPKEQLKHSVWPWVSMLLWMKPRPTFEFHIDVFEKDRARAEEVVRAIEKKEDMDLDDDEDEEPVSSPR